MLPNVCMWYTVLVLRSLLVFGWFYLRLIQLCHMYYWEFTSKYKKLGVQNIPTFALFINSRLDSRLKFSYSNWVEFLLELKLPRLGKKVSPQLAPYFNLYSHHSYNLFNSRLIGFLTIQVYLVLVPNLCPS